MYLNMNIGMSIYPFSIYVWLDREDGIQVRCGQIIGKYVETGHVRNCERHPSLMISSASLECPRARSHRGPWRGGVELGT